MSGGGEGADDAAFGGSRETLLAPERLDRPFQDPLFDRLFPPVAAGVHWDLGRTEAALAALGAPHRDYPSVHVGGTNGKGSVASTIAAVLSAAGHRVGLYTSPHLCSFRERIQVAGRPLSEERLVALADGLRPLFVTHGLTFFEAATVLAFAAFAAEDVDVAVVEVGLGGRLDATNVLEPRVSVVTNVAMDHAEYLGSTLGEIAREKAGIVKAGVPLVTAERDPALLEVFRTAAEGRAAPFAALRPDDLHDVAVDDRGTAFTVETDTWGPLRLRTPLVGAHQALNAALAVEAVERLPGGLRPTAAQVRAGVAAVRWPGRDQIERIDGTTWLLDVAHNTAGVASLTGVLDRLPLPEPRVALVGVLGDKAWPEMLPPLFRRVEAAVLTQPPTAPVERRWDPAAAARAVRSALGGEAPPIAIEVDFARAFAEVRGRAGAGTVVVTGSAHTVGAALAALGRPPFPDGQGPRGAAG